MSGAPVTLADSGGIAITAVDSGAPVLTVGVGPAVTLVDSGGLPFVVEGLPPTLTGLDYLKASGAVLAVYDPSDLNTMWQDIAGTTTQAVAGQPVGFVKNVKPGATGYHLAATATGLRPIRTNGLTFDGVDDRLEFTYPGSAGPSLGTIVTVFKTTDATGAWLLTGTVSTSRVSIAATTGLLTLTGAPWSTGGTMELDGVATATGVAVVNDGVAHTLVASTGLSTMTGLRIGGGTVGGQCLAGGQIPVAILDQDHAQYAAALVQAKAWAATLRTNLSL